MSTTDKLWTALACVVIVVALCVIIGLLINHEPGQRANGDHDRVRDRVATFHPSPLSILIDLSGRGRQERAGTGAAPVPVPAGQPHLDRHIEQAWQTAGVNARSRCWVPDMRDTATAWDRRNAAELRAILAFDANAPWLEAHFAPIMAQHRKAFAS